MFQDGSVGKTLNERVIAHKSNLNSFDAEFKSLEVDIDIEYIF